ncbi:MULTISPECIES: hypothetical protein [Methylotenera]|uniref:hypothetical protein n=1 Tax=Methylotenera TaxID=359407 RepID=UPI00036C1B91|nr:MULTISPECIES: hypothetical protein [Methylotenera]
MSKLNRVGVIFCIIYALIILACLAMAYSAGEDNKGVFVFLQLPIVFQMAAIHELGLSVFLREISWAGAYLLIGIPTFLLLYFVGFFINLSYLRLKRSVN